MKTNIKYRYIIHNLLVSPVNNTLRVMHKANFDLKNVKTAPVLHIKYAQFNPHNTEQF